MEAAWRIREHFPELSDETIGALRIFHLELLRFNQTLDLISNSTEKNADLLHFYDSIKSSQFIIQENPDVKEIYDFGDGNGFAGVVTAILYPNIRLKLIEDDIRKVDFLKHIIERTQVSNIEILNIQPEKLKVTEPVIAMSRGMANLARTLLLGSKVLLKDSKLYSLKSDDWFTELSTLPSQISSTWNTDMACEYELPESLGIKVLIRSIKTQ